MVSKIINLKKDKNFFEIIKGSSYTFLANVLILIMGFILNFIIARYYGSEVLGELSTIISIVAIGSILTLLGMDISIIKKVQEYLAINKKNEIVDYYRKNIIILIFSSLFISFFLYVFSDKIASLLFSSTEKNNLVMIASLVLIFFSFQNFYRATLKGFKSVKLYALLGIITIFINLLVLSLLTIFFYKNLNPIYSYVVSIVISCVISYLIVKKFLNEKIVSNTDDRKSQDSYKVIIIFSFPMFLTTGMQAIFGNTDIIMLSSMTSASEVGIYAISIKLAILTSFILTVVNSMMAPKIAEQFHANSINDLKKLSIQMSTVTFFGALPFFLVYVFFGKVILELFGSEFIDGYNTLLIISFGHLISAGAGSVINFLNMTGKQLTVTYIAIVAGVSNVILNYILIPVYGIEGAAIATMISRIVLNLLALFFVYKEHHFYMGFNPVYLFRRA